MAQTAITDKALERVNPAQGRRLELWDQYLEGFGYRATQRGKGSFFVMYRLNGRQQRYTIGRYPVMTLEAARAAAREALKLAREGKDPAEVRSAREEAEREQRERTVALAVEDFIAKYPKHKATTRAEAARLIRREVVPILGAKPIAAVTRKDVAQVINKVLDRGARTTANRLLDYLKAMFGWLVERGELEATPIKELKKPTKERSRDRVLNDEELRAVWRAAEDMAFPFGRFVQLLMLTAQRREEVAGMRRPAVDSARQIWTLDRSLTKSDRAIEVPLSGVAMEIISTLPNLDETLFFPASRRRKPANEAGTARHISGWSSFKRSLDKRANAHLHADGGPEALKPWILHDIRRSVASGMAALGVAPHVVERLLNHSTGPSRGVAAIYNRYSYAPEMRHAVDLWARHLSELLNGPAENVIPLRA